MEHIFVPFSLLKKTFSTLHFKFVYFLAEYLKLICRYNHYFFYFLCRNSGCLAKRCKVVFVCIGSFLDNPVYPESFYYTAYFSACKVQNFLQVFIAKSVYVELAAKNSK